MNQKNENSSQNAPSLHELTPREIVQELDAHIVGQTDAKRAVAVAVRNRWRRQQISEELRKEISPKNILMIGPTGVGKTELARRLAKLTQAPFVKVEATKYTEVGYYGRDVESMVRDLVENALTLVRNQELAKVKEKAEANVEEKILDILVPLSENPGASREKNADQTGKKTSPFPFLNGDFTSVHVEFPEDFPEGLKDRILNAFSGTKVTSNLDSDSHFNSESEEEMEVKEEYPTPSGTKAEEENGTETKAEAEEENGTEVGIGIEAEFEVSIEDVEPQTEFPFNTQTLPSFSMKKNAKNTSSYLHTVDGESAETRENELIKESEPSEEYLRELGQKASEEAAEKSQRLRENLREQLRAGLLEEKEIQIPTRKRSSSPLMMMNVSGQDLENGLSDLLGKMLPRKSVRRTVPISEARKIMLEMECDALLDEEKIQSSAIHLAENAGIIFLDEIDKIVASNSKHGADVSRQGVQRDLLPIVEGTTIQTRYGYVKTDHILFVAAGAFHQNKPGDLMPELQGRFPIRVELHDLTKDDFKKILREPQNALLLQYQALLETEGLKVSFQDEAIDVLAEYAWHVNQTTQNIGARRLCTILEKLLEDLSFEAPDMAETEFSIDAEYVREHLESISQNEDLSRFIL